MVLLGQEAEMGGHLTKRGESDYVGVKKIFIHPSAGVLSEAFPLFFFDGRKEEEDNRQYMFQNVRSPSVLLCLRGDEI